jgi:FAD/FMN-containing dehydrogenase
MSRLFRHGLRWRRPYSSVAASDIDHFRTILPPHAILSTLSPSTLPAAELDPYNNDWMGKYRGRATTVLRPKTTQQVSDIVRWCASRDIPIVPQGGNTGLVGGSVPLQDELIVSLASMNSVRSFDPVSGMYRVYLVARRRQ